MYVSVGSGNSGSGGDVIISAGGTSDSLLSLAMGGQVYLSGGTSGSQTGGRILIRSGVGVSTSGGSIGVYTSDSGLKGVSGYLSLSSGVSSNGNSGGLYLGSDVASSGRGGSVYVSVGSGNSGSGGDLVFFGGRAFFLSGFGATASSGGIYVSTVNSGVLGVSGFLTISSGVSSNGNSGGL